MNNELSKTYNITKEIPMDEIKDFGETKSYYIDLSENQSEDKAIYYKEPNQMKLAESRMNELDIYTFAVSKNTRTFSHIDKKTYFIEKLKEKTPEELNIYNIGNVEIEELVYKTFKTTSKKELLTISEEELENEMQNILIYKDQQEEEKIPEELELGTSRIRYQ
jgi:kynurenine formamidase